MNDPCSHASPKHPEQCSFLCAHFRLYPLVPTMTTVSHSVGPGPLNCLGCMKCYKRRHIPSKEKPFQKNTRLFLTLNVSIGPGCAIKILSTSGCRAHVVQAGFRWRKKNEKHPSLPWFVFVFFFAGGTWR